LGKYSFGLYLIHPMLLNLWSQVSSKLFPAASWTEFFIMLFVVTLFSLGLAKLMKRLPYHYLITGK
jgi:probable poly-beta-1,6-N-acetyl-D-glucosamine export protein